MSVTPSARNGSPRDMAACVFCGQDGSDGRLVPHDVRLPLIAGNAWQLSAACWDTHACHERMVARDARMDERYSLTAAGLAALRRATAPEVA